MSGLIVLVPYTSGQDFYHESEFDNEAYESEEFETESDQEDESIAYLPVHVQTEDTDLALMAVAYEACVKYSYVAFPSSDVTAQDWKERGFPGSLEVPGIELPPTEEVPTVPEKPCLPHQLINKSPS